MFTRLTFKLPTAPKIPEDPVAGVKALKTAYFELVHSIDDWFRSLNKKDALSALGDPGVTTGTPTSGTGALTTASYTFNWTKLGDRILYNGSVVITTNGTGATSIIVALPSTIIPKESSAGTGVDDVARTTLSVRVDLATKALGIRLYDGTYPGADGKTLLFAGQFRV